MITVAKAYFRCFSFSCAAPNGDSSFLTGAAANRRIAAPALPAFAVTLPRRAFSLVQSLNCGFVSLPFTPKAAFKSDCRLACLIVRLNADPVLVAACLTLSNAACATFGSLLNASCSPCSGASPKPLYPLASKSFICCLISANADGAALGRLLNVSCSPCRGVPPRESEYPLRLNSFTCCLILANDDCTPARVLVAPLYNASPPAPDSIALSIFALAVSAAATTCCTTRSIALTGSRVFSTIPFAKPAGKNLPIAAITRDGECTSNPLRTASTTGLTIYSRATLLSCAELETMPCTIPAPMF